MEKLTIEIEESIFVAGAVSFLVSSGVRAMGGISGYSSLTQSSITFREAHSGLLNAMTIAAGGLSTGLSSWITGGNF